jgi:hypothetical protein
VHLVQEEEAITAEESGSDRSGALSHAVPSEEELRADLVDGASSQHWDVRVAGPCIYSHLTTPKGLAGQERSVRTDQLAKHPSRLLKGVRPVALLRILESVGEMAGSISRLIDNDATVDHQKDTSRSVASAVPHEVV